MHDVSGEQKNVETSFYLLDRKFISNKNLFAWTESKRKVSCKESCSNDHMLKSATASYINTYHNGEVSSSITNLALPKHSRLFSSASNEPGYPKDLEREKLYDADSLTRTDVGSETTRIFHATPP